MTLDDAIKHAEEVVNANERLCETVHPAMQLSDYGKCAEEHRQLAEWLKDYKRLKKRMTKEDRDELLTYLTERTNEDVVTCRLRIAKENGKIEGMQMAAAQFAAYIRGQAEKEIYPQTESEVRNEK